MKDMEFMDMRKFTTDKVCTAMSVPKTILGYHDGVNFSNAESMYRIFIEETIRPLEILIAQFFSGMIQTEFNTDLSFKFVDNRNFDREEKITEATKLIDSGLMTINEARDLLGMERFDGVDNVDSPIIKNGYTSVDDLGLSYLPVTPSTNAKKIEITPKKLK
jgi:capsid portal protein